MFFDVVDVSRSFALIEKEGRVSCCQGAFHTLNKIDDIHRLARQTGRDIAFALPYRVIQERGFEAQGNEPILAMDIEVALTLPSEVLVAQLPDVEIKWDGQIQTSLSDEAYADLVREFQKNEIERGNASQTTLARIFSGRIDAFDVDTALAIYRKILSQRGQQYMAILFANIHPTDRSKDQFIVGATPEKHLEIRGNETLMLPIAGTLRKEDRETFEARLDKFMGDPKEINELFQVVDEEMKIMGVICPDGGDVEGPFLREIGAVVHSEYRLVGRRGRDTMAALRRTLHAPTVVGSPMESAARIIRKYEPESRRYYAGEIGIYFNSRTDAPNGDLDTAILIRCAEIDGTGKFRVQAGGGLVRDSEPMNEAKESRAKAMGVLGILTKSGQLKESYLSEALRQKVAPVLAARNERLSHFWMNRQDPHAEGAPRLDKLKVTILNNEDDFACMIGHMLRIMHAEAEVVDSLRYDLQKDASDIVILGPGPGDPTDMTQPRMKHLQDVIVALVKQKKPMLGICLGHQALAVSLKIDVERQAHSTQGMQRTMSVNGEKHRLGFYNSFSPVFNATAKSRPDIKFDTDETGRIIAMEGEGFVGFQFHPESIMSETGAGLLHRALTKLGKKATMFCARKIFDIPMPDQPTISVFTVQVTDFHQNCTVVVCEKTKECAVIDPGGEIDVIAAEIARRGLKVTKIWITHGHLDHGGGANALKHLTGAIIEGPHKEDAFWIDRIAQTAAYYGITSMDGFVPDRWLKDGDVVSIGDVKFQVIHCPGHTPGHVIYYNKENMFAQVGDVLFKNSIGRADLPLSDPEALIASITQKLWPLGDVDFVPGHGAPSNFLQERIDNPFVSDKALGKA